MTGSSPDLKPSADALQDLRAKLWSESDIKQLPLVQQLADLGEPGLEVLMEFLSERPSPTLAAGKAYQVLFHANSLKATEFLQQRFPQGIVPLKSDRAVDYSPLQILLAKQEFQEADQLTLQKLCELAGAAAIQRKWIYFTEVEQLPIVDLQTLDTLWRIHSEGRFGYSVQRDLWLRLEKDWERFWVQIDWKNGNTWTRYPGGFTWNLSAPRGHLPLSNQLRGVRVINSLFNHPAWTASS